MNFSVVSRKLYRGMLIFILLLSAAEVAFAVNGNLAALRGTSNFLPALLGTIALPVLSYFTVFSVMVLVANLFIKRRDPFMQAVTLVTAASLLCFVFVNLHHASVGVFVVFVVPMLIAMAYMDKKILTYTFAINMIEFAIFGLLLLFVYQDVVMAEQAIFEIAIPLCVLISTYAALRFVIIVAREMTEGIRKKEEESHHDPATNFLNRSVFFQKLDEYTLDSIQNGTDFSMVIWNIDHFQNIALHYGDEAPSDVVKEFVAALKTCADRGDTVFRYGEEEFMALTKRSAYNALDFSDRVRTAFIENIKKIPMDNTVTLSAGICEYNKDIFRGNHEFFSAANRALHSAQMVKGMNTSVVWESDFVEKRSAAY